MGLKRNSAIGLVANFISEPKQGVRQFSHARQFAQKMFADIESASNISLENCVYYRSGLQHYLVMTPTRASLEANGVFVDPDAELLTWAQNVRKNRVRDIASQVSTHFGLPPMPFAEEPNDVTIFDFSGNRRAQSGCAFLQSPHCPSDAEGSAMVVLVGDALMEPFWPEGLGIVRGFHSVLDATASINMWNGRDVQSAKALSVDAFSKLKTLNCSTAANVLQPDMMKYGVDPSSRYR